MKIARLRVRPKKLQNPSPCGAEMAAMLGCWAAQGVDNTNCANLANALRECMKNAPKKTKQQNAINYHLARLGKQL